MQNRITPCDAIVADLVKLLDDGQREDFEERAGIIEFDSQVSRGHAECLALLDVLRRYPAVLPNVVVLHIDLDGASQWFLTTNLESARPQLQDMGGIEIAILNVANVIEQQYAGLATLSTLSGISDAKTAQF